MQPKRKVDLEWQVDNDFGDKFEKIISGERCILVWSKLIAPVVCYVISCLGRATCTALSIAWFLFQERIKGTKAKAYCVLDVLCHQPIKLFQVVSTSKLHDY